MSAAEKAKIQISSEGNGEHLVGRKSYIWIVPGVMGVQKDLDCPHAGARRYQVGYEVFFLANATLSHDPILGALQ
jgi:hypothetical protein